MTPPMPVSRISLSPGPKPRYPGEYFWAFRRDPIAFFRRMAREGDFVPVRIGGRPLYSVNHPDLIRDVLVTRAKSFHKGRGLARAKRLLGDGLLTSEGDWHRRQRRLIQPAFHRQRIAHYAETMVECAARVGERWRDGEARDIDQEMMRLTLAIVGKTLFNADVELEAQEIGEAISTTLQLFQLLMMPYGELLEKLPTPMMRRFRQARGRLDTTVYRLIAEHRACGEDQGDLLSMLLSAQDEEDGQGMSDVQVRDEAMTLFLAGHETTSNALTWTWYLLSQHPDIEARFHAELDTALHGNLPAIDDLPKLPYTRNILAESLRLYPPAWVIGRRAVEEVALSDAVLPAGSLVIVAPCVTQVDPRWWPDPLRFDPARWTPEAEESRPKFAFVPFGGGPRVCIGDQFAWAEGILLLATLGQRWRLRLSPGHPVDWQPIITLRPKHGMRMTLHRQ